MSRGRLSGLNPLKMVQAAPSLCEVQRPDPFSFIKVYLFTDRVLSSECQSK